MHAALLTALLLTGEIPDAQHLQVPDWDSSFCETQCPEGADEIVTDAYGTGYRKRFAMTRLLGMLFPIPVHDSRHYLRPTDFRQKFDYPWHTHVPKGCCAHQEYVPPVFEDSLPGPPSTQFRGPKRAALSQSITAASKKNIELRRGSSSSSRNVSSKRTLIIP